MHLHLPDPAYTGSERARDSFRLAVKIAFGFVAVIWLIHLANWGLDLGPEPFGIRPRELAGLHGILFAPLLHGAMRHAAAVRREVGVRTVFNLLGPLTNPAGATRQVLGVYDPARVEMMARVLLELGSERAMVVHGEGLDEIATHGPTQVAELAGGEVRVYSIVPEDAGLARGRREDLAGGDVRENVAIARRFLGGERGPRRDAVLINAAAALVVAGEADDLRAGVARAAEAVDSGAALGIVERLRAICPGDSRQERS